MSNWHFLEGIIEERLNMCFQKAKGSRKEELSLLKKPVEKEERAVNVEEIRLPWKLAYKKNVYGSCERNGIEWRVDLNKAECWISLTRERERERVQACLGLMQRCKKIYFFTVLCIVDQQCTPGAIYDDIYCITLLSLCTFLASPGYGLESELLARTCGSQSLAFMCNWKKRKDVSKREHFSSFA